MANWLPCFGIYTKAINDAADTAVTAMIYLGFFSYERDDVFKLSDEMIKEVGDISHITNSVIWALFLAFKTYCHEVKKLDVKIDYFVNGSDSHLYIDGEEVIP